MQLNLERLNIGLETELENVQSESKKLKALLDNKTETIKVFQEENKRKQYQVDLLEAQLVNKTETIKALKK